MQFALEPSSNSCCKRCCRQGQGAQRSRMPAPASTRNCSQRRLKDRVMGKPSSANGNSGPAAHPKGQRPYASPSIPARDALPPSNSNSRTKQADQQASKALTSAISACSSLDMLREVLGPHLQQGEMDQYNITAAWSRLARLTPKGQQQYAAAHHIPQLRDQLANITLAKLQELGPRAAANIVQALGRLQLRPTNRLLTQLLGQLMACDGAMLHRAKPQELSMMACSLAQMVPLQQDERMGLLRIAEVAVSKLQLQGPTAFAASAHQAMISNLAAAYATAGLSAAAEDGNAMLLQTLFDELAMAALTRLPDFNAQAIATTAWAYAKVGHQHQELMVGIMHVSTPRLRQFSPRALANLLWAVATLHCMPEAGFMPAWAQAATQAADRFNAQDIATSLLALAKLRFYDTLLIRGMLHQAEMKLGTFNTQDLANSLLALAMLQHRDEAAIAALATAAKGRLRKFRKQGLANMLWALAALDFTQDTTTIENLLQQLAAQDGSKLTAEDCVQVWQACCWLRNTKGGWGRLQDCLEVLRMVDQCEQRTKAHMASFTASSSAQQEVTAVLPAVLADRAAGLEVAQEQQHPVTHQVVPIVLLQPGGSWAAVLAVDAGRHYAANKPDHLLGRAVLRNRLLQAQGLPVVTIPCYEWHGQKGKEAQEQYLHTKLDALLPNPPGA